MSIATKRITADELLTMPDNTGLELVNGEIVEKNIGFESGRVGGEFYFRFAEFCRTLRIGRAAPSDAGFQCFPDDPEMVRKPDAAFISFKRLPADEPDPRGWCRVAPEIAVEVLSPNDIAEDQDVKIEEYFSAGVLAVCIANPLTRTVQVHRPGRPIDKFGPNDELTIEDILPGFRCSVASLFPSPRKA